MLMRQVPYDAIFSNILRWIIGMYLHGFEKRILPDINKRSSPGERWE